MTLDIELDENKHSGFVAIVGRPNVGKSTLINHLLGQKISITSNKPQTTRHRILGVDTDGDCQAIYVDTPGMHKEEPRAINRVMNQTASSALKDVDLVLFVVENLKWLEDDKMVLEKIQRSKTPVVLLVNKVDQLKDKERLLPHLQWLNEQHSFAAILPISATHGDNIDELRKIVRSHLQPGYHYYPEDYVTDRSVRFMAAEIIREKLMRFTGDELPYETTVEIEQFGHSDKGTTHIHALILVERDAQKRMIIGQGGSKLKTIGTEARRDLEKLLDNKVMMKLWVKVKSGWSDDERALKSLGYRED
ncbi:MULTISPECIES: GTPase Era [Idiomarina]|jgi:GTP-binding protein Era|uniref:GTPase Era n=3 Tax=Idiomarina TaxID=135575 RepID=A0A8I1KG59_9GAMM|nr:MULTISPECIES: GTPase Era [Idiomarina]KPD22811.1 GTPase Era [Idiomarina abyssalis]MAB21321.1 GTPase Era [Idiomarina sp.]MAO68034.1 GTPase Era [Idiomarina sp.]MBF79786.1 GTPase Era [Idiomarina sp.]MBH95485.1 GTPase Era [Idiomarina sp.]|tara:strand:+ start:7049 stop:7966 length:918 start_codon:yes stop_codon:yes gene_type:complete